MRSRERRAWSTLGGDELALRPIPTDPIGTAMGSLAGTGPSADAARTVLREEGGTIAGLVLAGGLGRRFGGAKLAATLEGRPLLAHVLDTVRRTMDEGTLGDVLMVLPAGPDAPPEAALLRRLADEFEVTVVPNDDPAAGLARSLRLGLAALARLPVAGALVLLGDQPRTEAEVIRAVVDKWRRRPGLILMTRYVGPEGAGEIPGHPVLLARKVWPLARRLRGDSGMRSVARRHPELVDYLDVAGTNPDVDRPGDLEALRRPSA